MQERATGVVAMLPLIEMVKNSKLLSQEQKAVCLSELTTSLPPEMLCSGFMSTRKIVEEIIVREVANVQPKKPESKKAEPKSPTKKVTAKAKDTATQSPKK